ncbi:MAG: putative glycoside hydrolase [Acidimicrobiales bacterium]
MRRFLAIVGAICLVVLPTLAGTVSQSSQTAAADTPDILLTWGATMGGSQKVTAAQAVADAQSVNMLVGLPNTFSKYTASMRAANPALKMVFYLNGMYAAGPTATGYPESWYLHDSSSKRIYSTVFKNYLMDPTNSGWIQSRISLCSSTLASTGWDGCYLDMLGAGTLAPGYVSAPPIDPASGAGYTDTQWVTATTNLATQIIAALPGVYVVGNGLGTGNQYFSASWGPSSMLIGPLAAADAQGFVRGSNDPPTQFRSESQWKQDVDMLVDAGQRGKSVLVEAKVWNSTATQVQKDTIHRYALATFLLGTNGNEYWYWSDTGAETAVVETSAYENVNIGTPLGSYDKVLGVYQRRFSGGLVVVNPTSASVTLPLGAGQWTTLEGSTVSSQLTLAANTGEVLTASQPWGSVPGAATGTATNITPTSATVTGSVNPDGADTTAYAEFGTSGTLGQLSSGQDVGSGSGSVLVQFSLSGLRPGTTYTFHVDATNSAGTVAGSDVTFTTPLPAPTVRTAAAVVNSTTQATVNGVVNPGGQATTYQVDYGPTAGYGTSSSAQSAGAGTTNVTESTVLSGLPAGTLVHYRYEATNATGTTYGADRTVRL